MEKEAVPSTSTAEASEGIALIVFQLSESFYFVLDLETTANEAQKNATTRNTTSDVTTAPDSSRAEAATVDENNDQQSAPALQTALPSRPRYRPSENRPNRHDEGWLSKDHGRKRQAEEEPEDEDANREEIQAQEQGASAGNYQKKGPLFEVIVSFSFEHRIFREKQRSSHEH